MFKVLAVELGTWWGKCVASWGELVLDLATAIDPGRGRKPL